MAGMMHRRSDIEQKTKTQDRRSVDVGEASKLKYPISKRRLKTWGRGRVDKRPPAFMIFSGSSLHTQLYQPAIQLIGTPTSTHFLQNVSKGAIFSNSLNMVYSTHDLKSSQVPCPEHPDELDTVHQWHLESS